MKKDKYIYIRVYLHKKGFVDAGVITFNEEVGYAGFSYFKSYMENNYPPLNPSTLNWRDGYQRHFIVNAENQHLLDRTFWEMLPNANDWGNQVLISRYPEYGSMNNAQKLYFLGHRIVGGLESYTQEKGIEENINSLEWLDKVRDESINFYVQNISKISHIKAVNPMTSYGGVRPKCMFEDDNGDFWIAKFNVPNDPYNMAIGEHIALEMARDMGMNCAESKVIKLPSGEDVFLSKRFDRQGEKRYHSLSLFSLAPGNEINKKNYFAPGNPGGFMQKLVSRYSDFNSLDTARTVAKLLLDIGINNTDNHLRNTRLILDENNKWTLSPVFDIIFNPYNQAHTYNPAGLPLSELYLDNPNLPEAIAKELNVDKDIVSSQIEITQNVLSNWESYCDKYQLSQEDKNKIGNAISLGKRRKDYEIEMKKEKTIQATLNIPKLRPKT